VTREEVIQMEYETPAVLATFDIEEVVEAAATGMGGYNEHPEILG
jgi:hypothetical protein